MSSKGSAASGSIGNIDTQSNISQNHAKRAASVTSYEAGSGIERYCPRVNGIAPSVAMRAHHAVQAFSALDSYQFAQPAYRQSERYGV